MTDQPFGTESDPGAAAAPRVFSADELEAAKAQLLASGDVAPAATPDEIAQQALADGAQATSVDGEQMLAAIQALQAKVAALEAEKYAGQAPAVVKYAQALADHVQAKATANPAIDANPDQSYQPILTATRQLVDDAKAAAESGDPGSLAADVAAVESWLKAHGAQHPELDYSYLKSLAVEAATAVAQLAA